MMKLSEFSGEMDAASPHETLGQLLCWSRKVLLAHGIVNGIHESEWLLSFCLHCSRADLYLRANWTVDHSMYEKFLMLLRRRCGREPLQYILGTAPFCDLELTVDRRVLIPRPETEELLRAVVDYYSSTKSVPQSIADLGTGTGAIIIAL
ncbi:MAG: hypothetical protein LBG86_01225, partial [Puniceicoccales bacterium]|nr:hypothetical protein [Puniceicoccales bacterium]